MQSPACWAGPCRMATLLRLSFVASPQRMPDIGYRRVSIPVVDVIDRSPSVVSYNVGAFPHRFMNRTRYGI